MNETDNNPPDYRSDQITNRSKTYSDIVNQDNFPTKEHAIIFSTVDGLRLQDYLIPLGNIVQPKSIFSSRLSNNRICMYLSSKNNVENFMNNHGSIQIHGQTLRARRLITPAERLVLSNVCPTIPHEVIHRELEKLGLTMVSPITFLKISASLPEYSHILGFRRTVYVSPHNINLPDSIYYPR